MKRIIYLFSIVLIMLSCNDKEEFFSNQNSTPSISIKKPGSDIIEDAIMDSVKISLKSSNKQRTYRLLISDNEQNLKNVILDWIVGSGQVFQNNVLVNEIDFNQPLIDISIQATSLGTNILEIKAVDEFNETSKVEINLVAFENLKPIARLPLNLQKSGVEANLHYVISSSLSEDRDSDLGGGIMLYNYTIEGNSILSESKEIDYIFSNPGNKLIRLRVQDTDGVWSDVVQKTYSVN